MESEKRLPPRQAIKQYCRNCIGGLKTVHCEYTDCILWPLRTGKRAFDENGNGISPLKSIRKHCIWCCNDQPPIVRICADTECMLWPFRFGHKPKENGECQSLPSKVALLEVSDDEDTEGIIIPEDEE